MTDPAQGRDGNTVAALAIQISTVRQDLQSAITRIDVLTKQQREQTATLQAVSELRRRVEAILAYLDVTENASPATWFWIRMSEQEQREKFSELTDWVETVLRAQYPGYLADQLKPCWPIHPEARWELAWLYQLWSLTYLTRHPTPKDAADWHDRWLHGAIQRLSGLMRGCERGRTHQPG
jgi:hypothetical protein